VKILFVIDVYDFETNGITISAKTFMNELRLKGHEVRFLCASDKPGEEFKYCLPPWKIRIVKNVMRKQGVDFAKIDRKIIAEALDGVDIVHTFMPFKVSKVVYEMATERGIPVIAAFHIQPQNVSYNFPLMKIIPRVNAYLYGRFRRKYYKLVKDIHCPTQFIADELVRHKYKAKMHVISNGVAPMFTPGEKDRPEEWADKFTIVCVGRFAPEKRQKILMKAVANSKYRDKIQLVFCGSGPRDNKLKKLAEKLKLFASFGHYKRPDLLRVLRSADLYVQPSKIEIECIACIEAFATGLVPIIANSKLSATRHFAIDDRSLFKVDDPKDLTKKIEHFYENPQEVKELREQYIEKGREYALSKSVDKIEEVYKEILGGEN
jgi:glycosyltransferase involved in cell wall biosynthesis